MKSKFSDVLVQLGVAVVATVLASLVMKFFPLDVTQMRLVAVTFFAAVEAVIILGQRCMGPIVEQTAATAGTRAQADSIRRDDVDLGLKHIEYAIGLVPYANVLWIQRYRKHRVT